MGRITIVLVMVAGLVGPEAAAADGGHTFRNCTEARAAGYTNIRRGTYGYGPHLDRDNDGIGCES
jgi:hypothetical protein